MTSRTRRVDGRVAGIALALGAIGYGAVAPAVPPGFDPSVVPTPTVETAPMLRPSPIVPHPAAAGFCDLSDTGGDQCGDAEILSLPVDGVTTTICGDNSMATAADCGNSPRWWEAFQIDRCADVTISFCGTTPVQKPSSLFVFDACPCGSLTSRTTFGRGAPICSDDNVWMTFQTLAPGIYYYPVFSDEGQLQSPTGPYQLQITATECTGACCDAALGTCTDAVAESGCAGAQQEWFVGDPCCRVECLTDGSTYDASNIALLARVPLQQFPGNQTRANDIWGYTSSTGGRYAIIGLGKGVAFVDVSLSTQPQIVGYISDGANTVWRDMKVLGSYAYLVSDGSGTGIQIVDLTDIDDGVVTRVGIARPGNMLVAHNISINTESGFAYLSGANQPTGGLVAVDLADPVNPVLAGSWSEANVHDAQVVSYDDCPYAGRAGQPCEIAFAFAGGSGVKIIDVTDKTAMTTISTLTYPTLAFCHQGWLSEDRRYLFWNDELDESARRVTVTTTYVGDVQDLAQPTLLTTFTSNMCSIDHNLMVRGNRLYEANYTTGLRVFDIQDINNVREIAHFDTHPGSNAISFDGSWGVFAGFSSGLVILSDIQRGLFVLCEEQFFPVPNDVPKNRTITIGPGALGPQTALRVELVRMYVDDEEDPVNGCPVRTDLPDLSAFEGQIRWAGPPAVYSEDTDPPLPDLIAAPLQCCPHFRDWSPQALAGLPGGDADSNVLNFFGAEIVPCSTYRLQAVDLQCEPFLDESCFSPPQTIQTAKWGDVWEPYGTVNFTDIGKEVDKFKGIAFDPGPPASGAPIKAQAMLRDNVLPLDAALSFTDIGKAVDAFKQIPYSEVGPDTCAPCD